MKKIYTCEIGKATFTWKGTTINNKKGYKTLYDCYNKPSNTKCFIWYAWQEWANNNNFNNK